MWLTRLAIARPLLIWMALAAIAILGLRAYSRLPAELNPRADVPTLTVTTVYPGAGPPEIEAQISRPLETAVGTVGGVRGVYSSSQADVSIVSVDFEVGTDLNVAQADMRGRLEALRADLPPEARPPVIAKLDINAQPVLYVGLECASLTLPQLRALADKTLRPALERVAGVATVQILGGRAREIEVEADNARLAAAGLTIEDVINALRASGHDVPGGSLTAGARETDVRLTGAFASLASIRQTPLLAASALAPGLNAASNPSGMAGAANLPAAPIASSLPAPPLTIADVATVTDGLAAPGEISRINGREGVSLVFTKSPDANTVAVVDGLRAALNGLKLPPDLHQIILRDDSRTVRGALEDVNLSLILGAVLAMAVILLFLHNLRGTVIVALAIPACIVATFLVMWAASFTLNQMTLLALSLSVGILVDDSIVVLESITRHLSNGEAPREAALNGRAEIGFADLTTTLVDVVVFVPIGFMGGIVGGFFRQFGLTIAAATLFSLVVSFTVTPMLAARWYRAGERIEAQSGVFAPFERFYQRLESRYRRVIAWALRRRALVCLSAVGALALIFLLSFSRLGVDLLPSADQGLLTVNVEMPPGTSLAATDRAVRRVETLVAQDKDVRVTLTNVGQILGGFGDLPQQGPQFAQVNVRLNDKGGLLDRLRPGSAFRRRTDQDVASALRARLRALETELGARLSAAAVGTATGASARVMIELRGDDADRLTAFAAQVRDLAARTPGILDPDVSARGGKPEIRIALDPARAAPLGLTSGQAGQLVRDALTGNADARLRENGGEVPIRVRLAGTNRDNLADVQNLVVGATGPRQPILLGDVADITQREGPTSIERSNGLRLVTVRAGLSSEVSLGTVRAGLQRQMDGLPHAGITIGWGGESETLDENVMPFVSALVLGILLVYIVMASLFNNLGTPFVIMFTLPMALIGALGALVLTGETMSLVSAIGVIMLVGLMTRNAILLLDYTNTLREQGMARTPALIEAGATRLRPILMTTTATMAGMLPVALRIGEASEVRAPMAIVVIGGLSVSTVLTLLVIPVLYSLYDDRFGAGR